MKFLNKTRNESRMIWLQILLAVTFIARGVFSAERSYALIPYTLGTSMFGAINGTLLYCIMLIFGGLLSYLIFTLVTRLGLSLARAFVAGRTRNFAAFPISDGCYINHMSFVFAIVNAIAALMSIAYYGNPVPAIYLDTFVEPLLSALGVAAAFLMLRRVGIGKNVTVKLAAGLIVPFALLVVIV